MRAAWESATSELSRFEGCPNAPQRERLDPTTPADRVATSHVRARHPKTLPDAPRLRSPARSARAKSRLADLRDRFSRHETVASTRVAGRACCGGRSTWMCAPTHSSSARPPAPAGGTHPSTVEASARRIGLATVLIGRIVGIDSAVVTHPSRAGASPVVPSRGSSARSTRAPRRRDQHERST